MGQSSIKLKAQCRCRSSSVQVVQIISQERIENRINEQSVSVAVTRISDEVVQNVR